MNSRAQESLGHKPTERQVEHETPKITHALVEWFERKYPDVCPPPETSRDEFLVKATEARISRDVKALFLKQNKRRS